MKNGGIFGSENESSKFIIQELWKRFNDVFVGLYMDRV